jgi:hypothetical protein
MPHSPSSAHSPAGATGGDWPAHLGRLLTDSSLLTALVDAQGTFLFQNPALRAHTEATEPAAGALPELFTAWSRDKLLEAGLPTAQQWGLWEGGLTLRSHQPPATVHATLVGETRRKGRQQPDDAKGPGRGSEAAILALLIPHQGSLGYRGGRSDDTPDLSGHLAIPLQQETRLLDPADITHLEAHGAYTQLFLSHQALLTSLRLSWFEATLPDVFVRTHRGYVANIQRVDALVRHDGHLHLRMDSPAAPEVPVSRRREPHIRGILNTAQQVRGPGD